ncbi:MAG TPA: carbon monoxide dehydrogenase subunit G [Xanthobacteraceae bacterium]|nr:carbon monoxide dehydrogenase subunit G [Xanthobacteraceae bacterium]
MEIKGTQRIEASRTAVWTALNDPEVLKQSIPGCESIEKVSDTEMNAKARLRIGPVKASFSGKVILSDLDPPNGYTITGTGSGGTAGFAKGGAKVRLAEDGSATLLTYDVEADIGGKLASLGGRLIEGTAKKLAAEFFEKFSVAVTPPAAHPVVEPAIIAAAAPKKAGWLRRMLGKG